MRTFSATIQTELAKTTGVELRTGVRLYLDSGTISFCTDDNTISVDSLPYLPRRISHGPIRSFFGNKTDNCDVSIDNADLVMSAYAASDRFAGRKAQIIRFFMNNAGAKLNGNIDKTDTDMVIKDVTGTFPVGGGTAYINGESFTYTSADATHLYGCSQRLNGHVTNAVISGSYAVDFYVQFTGYMDTPKVTEKNLSFRIVNIFDRSQSYSPWRRYDSRCNWDFCSAGYCAYNGSVKPQGTASYGSDESLIAPELVGASSLVGAQVRILSGANKGSTRYIYSHNAVTGQIYFLPVMGSAAMQGSRYLIECDKSFSACRKMSNTLNFGGYPYAVYASGGLSWANGARPGTVSGILSDNPGAIIPAAQKLRDMGITQSGDVLPIVYGTAQVRAQLVAQAAKIVGAEIQRTSVFAFAEGEISQVLDVQFSNVSIPIYASAYKTYVGGASEVLSKANGPAYNWAFNELASFAFKNTAFFAINDSGRLEGWDGSSPYYNDICKSDHSETCHVTLRGLLVQAYLANGTPDGAPAWSANPVWCLLDFLMNRAMQRVPAALIDFSAANAAALTCNTLGYTVNLALTEQKSDKETIDLMLAACRGFITYSAGQIAVNIEKEWVGGVAHSFDDTVEDNIHAGTFEGPIEADVNDTPNRIIVKYVDTQIRKNVALLSEERTAGTAYTSLPYGDLAGSFTATGSIFIGGEEVAYTANSGGVLTVNWTPAVTYIPGYPLFQGSQLFPEQTAIYNDYDNQDAVKRVIERTIDGRAIGTYKQAYAIAEYHGKKAVDGAVRCRLRGMFDSLELQPGDVADVTHTVPGWTSELFRVEEASESEDGDVDYVLRVYDPGFYSESGTISGPVLTTTLPNPHDPVSDVTNISLVESQGSHSDGSYKDVITLTYDLPADNTGLMFEKAHIYVATDPAGPWLAYGYDTSLGHGFEIDQGFQPGNTVYVRVVGVNKMGVENPFSTAPTASIVAVGKLVPPSNVTGFSAIRYGAQLVFKWTAIADIDAWAYEIRYGTTWNGGTVVVSGVTQNTYTWVAPESGTYTFWIKAIDTQGIYSSAPTSYGLAVTAIPDVSNVSTMFRNNRLVITWDRVSDYRGQIFYEVRFGSTWASAQTLGLVLEPSFISTGDGTYWIAARFDWHQENGITEYSANPASIAISGSTLSANVVQTWDEFATGFTGDKTAGLSLDESGYLQLSGAGEFDSITDLDAVIPSLDFYGGVATTGTYTIPDSHIVDLGYAAVCTPSVSFLAAGYASNPDNISLWNPVSSVLLVSGSSGEFVSVVIQINISTNGTDWAGWKNWYPGDIYAWKVKFRAILTSTDPSLLTIVKLQAFSFTVDMPDITDKGNSVSIDAAGTAVTFAKNFQTTPNIQITILNAQAGDQITFPVAKSATGFTIRIMNGGSGVARTIDWFAAGY